ncbi:MAG: type IV pilus biogenesis/stability protein PilW [Caulobacter sp.]|nr:type IV pilus biogenesis/stability protein PilW [Vitreoscilla sp.]
MHLVIGPARASRRMRAALAAAGLLMGLAGCVTTGGPAPRPYRSTGDDDIKTASDQTNADRLSNTRMELAQAYLGRNQPTDALDQVKQALQAKPNNPSAYGLRGLMYPSLGDADKADESFQRARQLAPHDADLMHNYGWTLCQQGRFADANAQFMLAIAEPSYRQGARTLLVQGICQLRAGQPQEAEKTLSRAYELDPANPTIAVNLAEVLYRNGQYERARFYIRRVNNNQDLASAQTLWLAARIEHKLGQEQQVNAMGLALRNRFPQSTELSLFEKGKFDE